MIFVTAVWWLTLKLTEFENFLFISEPAVLTFASFLTLVPLVVKSYLRLMSAEYAIVYAALILQDDGIEITVSIVQHVNFS
jgi:hypothetical protein